MGARVLGDRPDGCLLIDGLASAAFPDAAQALLRAPPGGAERGLLIYLHGFGNCIYNGLAPLHGLCPHGVRPDASANLLAQLDEVGCPALLLLPEIHAHQQRGAPGALAEPGAGARLVDEVLAAADIDARAESLPRVVLASHSGAYQAAAALLQGGAAEWIQEVFLLDSLYGHEGDFIDLVAHHAAEYVPPVREGGRRFVVLYGDSTDDQSRAFFDGATPRLRDAGVPEDRLRFNDHAAPPDERDLAAALLVRRVPAGHSQIPGAYLAALLRSSGLVAALTPG